MHTYSVPEDILADKRHKNWFWDSNEVFNSGLSVNAIVVRLYLARCANGERQAWPSLNTIARSCGISKPTVIKALKELEEKGWITKKIQRRASLEYTTTIYTLNDPPKPSSSPSEGGGKGDLPPVKIETGGKEGVVNDVDQVVKQVDNLVNDDDNVVNEVDPNNTHITIPKEEIPMEEKEMLLSSLRSDNNISGPALRAPSADVPPEKPFCDPGPYRAVNRPKKRDSRPQAGAADGAKNGSKELIAELVREYRSLGVEERARDYAIIGSLYNRHGYEKVFEGIAALGAAMAVQEVRSPLLYLKGILEPRKKASSDDGYGYLKPPSNEAAARKLAVLKAFYT